jgi:hypothetical protein
VAEGAPKGGARCQGQGAACACAIGEVLPNAIQVVGRFHLMQNMKDRSMDIAKEAPPSGIFIRGGAVLASRLIWWPMRLLRIRR